MEFGGGAGSWGHNGYKHHASKEEPQYLIKSDKTDHVAIRMGTALRKIKRGKE